MDSLLQAKKVQIKSEETKLRTMISKLSIIY